MTYSIIIPIYNTPSVYLEDCLRGLFLQDYPKDKYEIILVDDASTEHIRGIVDDICERYESKPQIQFIRHTHNKRQGGARNTGLEAANGDYVMFLDSDDYWDATNVLSVFELILEHGKFDILRSFVWKSPSSDVIPEVKLCPYNNEFLEESGINYLSDSSFSYEIWSACYRRSFLLQNQIYFRENVVFEDSDWAIKAFYYARCIAIIQFPFYNYRLNLNSTTTTYREGTFIDNVSSIAAIDDFVQSVKMPDICKNAIYSKIKKSILSYIRISRNYQILTSVKCIRGIRRSLLKNTSYYKMSIINHMTFMLLYYCPIIVVVPVRFLALIKRNILNRLLKWHVNKAFFN